MNISDCDLISISEANKNFSAIAHTVDARGRVVVLKNNRPRYVIYSYDSKPMMLTDEEAIMVAGRRVLNRHLNAFKELAK